MTAAPHSRHVVVILKHDPHEEPLECTLGEAAELLGLDVNEVRQGFVQCGRFDTDRHVVLPLDIEQP